MTQSAGPPARASAAMSPHGDRRGPETSVVLLPGMDGTGRLFAPLVASLADELGGSAEVRVARYPPNVPQTLDEHVATARAALPLDRPFVIVAESFSGPVAVALAATQPPGLRGLVLACTFASNPRPGLRALRGLAGLVARVRPPKPVLARALLGRNAPASLLAELSGAIDELAAPVLAARLRIVLDADVRASAALLRVPALCLVASRDRIVPAAATDALVRALPHARSVPLDGPHLLLQTHPAESARAIAEFVRSLG